MGVGVEVLAQYGIAVFSVGGLFWVASRGIDAYCTHKPTQESQGLNNDRLVVALENNTKVMEGLGEILSVLRIAQAEQSTMLHELISHARK